MESIDGAPNFHSLSCSLRIVRADALDDLEHYQTTRINPLARKAALALGRKLQEHGVVTAPEDVFFLRKSDLEELVAAYPTEDRVAFRARADTGKEAYELAQRRTPSWSLDGPSAGVKYLLMEESVRPYVGLDLSYLHLFGSPVAPVDFVGLGPNIGVDWFLSDSVSIGVRAR